MSHMNTTHTCFARVLRVTLLWRFSVISCEEQGVKGVQ